ncbi:MAG: VOC family protein [Alphaproteobacteria bacterium]|nr:VOC family protein [Alphaproteobacteria bacterium]MBV9421106.1 VOC family protein [Alphaproteobacteria bacterium]MBV9904063.1 VOC family protein [Alphaproteobacteria bacterium]
MLHHVSVGVTDFARAAKFYDAVLATLGFKRVADYSPHAIGYGTDRPEFWVGAPHDGRPMSVGNGTHLGFIARTKAQVHKFHEVALANGGSNNGEPGPRPDYGPDYYGAFVYDLDGNKIEAALLNTPVQAKTQSAKKSKSKSKGPVAKRAANKKPKKKVKRR